MISGFYNILKPTGFTSSDAVVKLRGILNSAYRTKVKIGHFGTLDPGGSGVLVVAVGNATKLFDRFTTHTKTYRAEAVFGATTDTLDSYGEVLEKCDWYNQAEVMPDSFYNNLYCNIDNTINSFLGKQKQLPPIYSSKSINGVRAYDLARNGEKVKLNEADIEIFSIKINRIVKNRISFDITCSSGTYIRSFVRDLGLKLGVPAFMSYIIRLECAGFSICDSVTLDEVSRNINAGFTSLEEYSKRLPVFKITEELKNDYAVGNKIYSDLVGLIRVEYNERFLSIGEFINRSLKVLCVNDTNPVRISEFDKEINKQKYSLALGYFDTLHIGHLEIIRELSKLNGIPSLFTFSKSLNEFIKGKSERDLYSFRDRVNLFEKYGVKTVFVEEPNRDFLNLTPYEFLDYLTSKINIGAFVCGYDYTFGVNASGNIDILKTYCEEHNIEFRVIDEKTVGEKKVSSTLIKESLKNGDILSANAFLGRTYSVLGRVQKGRMEGRLMGFPTANISLDDMLILPKYGVYKGRVRVQGKTYNSIINIGTHPTFDDNKVNLEAYIINFDKDIYGYLIEVFLDDYIRDIVKFNSIDELKEQLKRDLGVFNE